MREHQSETTTSASIAGLLAPVGIILLGVGALAVFGRPEAPQRQTDGGEPPVNVETAAVEVFTKPFVIEVDGEAAPFRLVTLSAEVPGRISIKNQDSRGGKFVSEETLLFEIDRTDFDLAVERWTAQVRQADEDLAAADVDIANTQTLIGLARQEWEIEQRQVQRTVDLAGRGATSDRDLDDARAEELRKKNALQTLENELLTLEQRKRQLQAARDLADAQKRQADADLERTRVTAPLDATVVEVHVEQGDYVQTGDPLVVLSDASKMEVQCSLTVDDLVWVWLQSGEEPADETVPGSRQELPPTPVEVHFAFQGDELIWEGELDRYAGSGLDPATRLIDCRVRVDDPGTPRLAAGVTSESVKSRAFLVSGMYVSVHIPIYSPVPLLRLPEVAVRPGGKVWVARNGELHIELVEVAETVGDSVLIRADLTELESGDRVIVSPMPAVRDRMPVRERTGS